MMPGGPGPDSREDVDADTADAGDDAARDARGGPPVRRLADWDGTRLADLAAEHDTPLYVLDTDRVRENCWRLQVEFPDADVRYAAKAHTGRAVLEAVRDEGLGVECASAGEVVRAVEAGFEGEALHYTAVNPPARDLDRVVQAWREHPGLTVTVGATDTLVRLRQRDYDGRVCIRVNPGVGAGHHPKVRTGGHAKFGVPIDRAADLAVALDDDPDLDLVGLHAHAGSGISGEDLATHREFVRRLGDLVKEVENRGVDLEYVDVGGGFGVPGREDDPALDLETVAKATRAALGRVDAQLAIEPGRYVVADAGVLLARVNTVKETAETVVAGVDAGMTDLVRPAMYDAYHPVRNLSAAGDRATASVTVAGPVCESADVLCTNRPLPRPERGDLLAVGMAGAYGYEMASTYNSRPRPAEVRLDGRLLRRRETIADLTRLERGSAEGDPDSHSGDGEDQDSHSGDGDDQPNHLENRR